MESQARFITLFDYDQWANLTVFDELQNHPSFEHRERTLEFLNHIIGTQHHWYQRVTGTELRNTEIWPDLSLAECNSMIEANHQRWVELIQEEQNNIDKPISYQNSRGVKYESLLSDILQHIVIHGQHHRSQIALLLRMSGIAPPATDYIIYTREQ